jgi:DNA invertase Pin-like site-specific DNA recombinase
LGLFVIRESDEWDLELFNAMREQTYQNHRHLPQVDAVREAALAPLNADHFEVTVHLEDGRTRRDRVIVEEVRKGTTRAYLFYYEGYWHLWSRASATKLGDAGVNDFTAILMEVIERVRPKELFAANFSRLVRSQTQGNRLASVLEGNVDVVWAGRMPITLCGEHAPIGLMMIGMFATVASLERDWIVQRLLTGRIAKWRNNVWPHGPQTVPFGYLLDEQKRLVPDVSKRDAVREMLLILSAEMPPAETVRQLDRAGVTSMRAHRRLKRRVPIGAMASPQVVVDSLYSWALIWVRGEYLFRVSNVFRGMNELAGVPIVHDPFDPEDRGEMQMLYKPGVPEGGWAEEPVLEAFMSASLRHHDRLVTEKGHSSSRPLSAQVRAASADPVSMDRLLSPTNAAGYDRATVQRRAGARARRLVSVLAGRHWLADGWYYELYKLGEDRFKLIRWPVDAPQHLVEVVDE